MAEVYRLQQKAPKPRRIDCRKEIPNKPAHYGKEFHGCISLQEADDLVSEADGCYLVRESPRSPGSYTLTMRFQGVSKNFRLYYDGLYYVGEKRFKTIQDLVADGLITMYIDTYAKDYVDTMLISPMKLEEKKDERKTVDYETKENDETAKEAVTKPRPPVEAETDAVDAKEKRQDQYKKHHTLKMHTFIGAHWCDVCGGFLWALNKKGLKCQDCGLRAHAKCSSSIPANCQPVSRGEKPSQKPSGKAANGDTGQYGSRTLLRVHKSHKITPSGRFEDYDDLSISDKDDSEDQPAPLEILVRGPLAVQAYQQALLEGVTTVKRVPVMLIGQGQSGKTSLKRSLKGERFDPEETSTTGIEMDPSYCKVSTEVWKVGEKSQATVSDPAPISYEQCTAQYIVSNLKKEIKGEEMKEPESSHVKYENVILDDSPSTEDNNIHSSELFHASRSWSHDTLRAIPEALNVPDVPKVPEEIAGLIEKLYQVVDNEEEEEEIYSILWDFGGQSVYYATHPLFLTTRAIYCLVYNLSRNPDETVIPQIKRGFYKNVEDVFCEKSNMDYLDVWMSSVSSLVPQDEDSEETSASEMLPQMLPPVFLVCTHADKPYKNEHPKELARDIFGSLQTKRHGKHLFDVYVVDNTKSGSGQECSEVIRLRNDVLNAAKELPHMKEAIPIKWLEYEKSVRVMLKDGYKWISFDEAQKIALDVCGISSDEHFEALLNFLHDQRILLHFDDTPELNKMVILDLQWLIDVFKKIITITPYDSNERNFTQLWLKLETTGILEEKLLQHVWGPLFDNQETCKSLIAMMEKFCLLCPWSSSAEGESPSEYIVPSMLKFPPKEDVTKLIASAGIPSLFVKFKSGQVPPGLFPRLVLMVFQWCTKKWFYQSHPQLYYHFARFFTHPAEGCSIILLCHSSSIEVVVHKEDCTAEISATVPPGLNLSSESSYDTFQVAVAHTVCRQLGLMLECMRKEFHWLKNMTYDMSMCCPVCCKQGAVEHCRRHNVRGCKQEECLHFWSVSQLRECQEPVICTKSVVSGKCRVSVNLFGHWVKLEDEQRATDGGNRRALPCKEGDSEQTLVLPSGVLEALQLQACDANDVVARLQESLSLEQESLEQPDPETKRQIRCLCMKAKTANRLDVVKKLREIAPAGTTGPLLPEARDVNNIPFAPRRELTINLCGRDEWKLFAERLGLSPAEILYLDKRVLNPCDAALAHSRNQGYITSVGDLYDTLVDCELPVMADLL